MVDRFEDIYEFNIEGNFEAELNRLRTSIAEAQAGFLGLRGVVQKLGAEFRAPAAALKKLKEAGNDAALAAEKQKAAMVSQISQSKALALAYNQLAREHNRLVVSRAKEQFTLELIKKNLQPQIIQARAEARALQAVTKALEEKAFKSTFAAKAAEAGLKVSADGKRIFDAEATAVERAAKAQQELAVSRELAARGLTPQGTPQLVKDGQLTEEGRLTAQRAADARVQKTLLNEQELAILKNNKAWIESKKAANAAQKEINALTGVGNKTEGTFNRISFTFRRLIGIMAAFTIAREVVSGFNSMIATAIRFNAEIETSRVGLAGLIAASAEVRGFTGQKLGIDNQVLASQKIAIDQMAKLRKEALETAATYDELAQAFQTAVAPGIQAGLGLDQIREVTVLISQAATGLGVAQNQLAEEIRSLFQGTITPRNTRIATALGISNQDIARAKELGILFEFLSSRFAAIGKTGKLLLNTFTGQLSNASDALKQLLAVSSAPLFEQLKAGLREIQDAIFDTSKDADNMFNEKAITAFKGLFEGLANGVRGIRAAFRSIDATSFGDAFASIGQALGAVVSSLANLGTFLINAAAPTVTVFAGLLNVITKSSLAIKTLLGPLSSIVGSFVLMAARGLIFYRTLLLVRAVSSKLPALWNGISKAILGAAASTQVAEAGAVGFRAALNGAWIAAKRFLIPIALIATAIAAVDKILESFGVKFSVLDVIGGIFGFLNESLDKMLGNLTGVKEELSTIDKSTKLGTARNDFRGLKSDVEDARNELEKLKDTAAREGSVSDILRGRESSAIAKQAAVVQEEINKAFDTEPTRKMKAELIGVKAEVQSLQKQYDDLGNEITSSVGLRPDAILSKEELSRTKKEIESIDSAIAQLNKDSANQGGSAFAALLKQRQDLEKKIRDSAKQDLLQSVARIRFEEERQAIQEKLNDSLATEAELKELVNALEFQANVLAQEKNKTSAKDAIFEAKIRLEASAQELSSLEASNLAFEQQNSLRQETIQRSLELAQLESQISRQKLADEKDLLDIDKQIDFARQQNTDTAREAVKLFEEQKRLKGIDLQFEEAINAQRVKRLQLEIRLAKLREQGSANQGIGFGLQSFAQENASLFNVGESFGKELAGAIPRFAGDALKTTISAAFDRTQNVDLGAAIADIGAGIAIDLATNLAEGVISSGVSSLIQSLGINIFDTGPEIAAATEAESIRATGAAAAAGTTTTAAGTATATWTTGGTTWATTILAAAGQAATLLNSASATSAVAGSGLARGGAVDRAPRHRFPNLNLSHRDAVGYAHGGRPSGIDPRDTIPAFLRTGEWVIRPEAVKFYGDHLFDLLNRRRLNPDALRGVSKVSAGPSAVPRLKRSFATGGPVIGPSRGASRQSIGQVIQFHDEQTMERALAAGPNAPVRFARSRRGAYRAAIGIDPGT